MRLIHCTSLYLKPKSKQGSKSNQRKAPAVTDLDISSEILDEIGITLLGEESAQSISKMNEILDLRIVPKITTNHIDLVQLESKEGFIPLKLISQLSFPKPNLIRLDMSHSKEHLQNATKALKKYFPFAGIHSIGYDTIEIETFKLNKVIKQDMLRDARKCSQDTKSILRNLSAPVLKKLKSQKGLPKDSIFRAESHIKSIMSYYEEEIDNSVEKKQEEIDSM